MKKQWICSFIVLWVLYPVVAISATDGANLVADPIQVTLGPNLTMDPNDVTPLAGVVELETVPVRAEVNISDNAGTWVIKFSEYQMQHSLPILGLKPDSNYEVVITLYDQLTNTLVLQPLQAATEPLPMDFPSLRLLVSKPEKMEPGFTLLDKFSRGRNVAGETYAIIVDSAGEVVWYSPLGANSMLQLPNGNLFFRDGLDVVKMDMLGVCRT